MSTREETPKKPVKISKAPVMDIVRPGVAMPNASARPIIVGHKPMVQDPMVNDNTGMAGRSTEKSPVARSAPKVIAPIIDDADVGAAEVIAPVEEAPVAPEAVIEAPTQETSEDVSDVVAADENPEPQEVSSVEPEEVKEPEPAVEPTEEATETVTVDSEPEPTPDGAQQESAVIDAVVGQASAKSIAAKQADDDKKRLDEQDKLIDSKEYFVPIGERRRKKRRTVGLVLLLLLILGSVGGYMYVDKFTDVPLPYEFFISAEQRKPLQIGANTPGARTDQGAEVTKEEVYTNKEFGFQFVLPAGFATSTDVDRVVILDGTTASLAEQGRAFRIDISPKFSGGFVTKDWKLLPRPPVELVEPAQPPLGFIEYPACTATGTYAKILFEDETTCVIATASQDAQNTNGVYVISVRKKLLVEQIAGLEFAESPVGMERYTRQGLETALQKNNSRNQDIIRFAQSIKALQ